MVKRILETINTIFENAIQEPPPQSDYLERILATAERFGMSEQDKKNITNTYEYAYKKKPDVGYAQEEAYKTMRRIIDTWHSQADGNRH